MKNDLNIPVIGITGSAGKSTTKEMLASILKQRWNVLKTVNNLNLPVFTKSRLKKLKPYHKAAVLEFGAKEIGDITKHCAYVKPSIGIITLLGSSHIGKFGSRENLIKAKSELISGMKKDGLLVLNKDNEYTKELILDSFKGEAVYFSIDSKSDYQAYDVNYAGHGMGFKVRINDQEVVFHIPVFGTHMVYNALAAIAVADRLGFSVNDMKKGLLKYKKMQRRITVSKGIKGSLLIDDSYSASPEAVKAAIDVLVSLGQGRPTIAILGGMAELGTYTKSAHRLVGEYVAKQKISKLITVGNPANIISNKAVEKGMPDKSVTHYRSVNSLKKKLHGYIDKNSCILVKASHDYSFDKIVDFLTVIKHNTKVIEKKS